jgi:hypothetical protein
VVSELCAVGRGFDEEACSQTINEDLVKTRSRGFDTAFFVASLFGVAAKRNVLGELSRLEIIFATQLAKLLPSIFCEQALRGAFFRKN